MFTFKLDEKRCNVLRSFAWLNSDSQPDFIQMSVLPPSLADQLFTVLEKSAPVEVFISNRSILKTDLIVFNFFFLSIFRVLEHI